LVKLYKYLSQQRVAHVTSMNHGLPATNGDYELY
jgi:hypothetical protein